MPLVLGDLVVFCLRLANVTLGALRILMTVHGDGRRSTPRISRTAMALRR